MTTKKKAPTVARKIAAKPPKKKAVKPAKPQAPRKRQLYLNLRHAEIEFVRSVGHGSFTDGLRELVKLDVPPVQMADVYQHRTSVRITEEDLKKFMVDGNGSVTYGIRRAMQFKMALLEQANAIA